MRRSGLIPLDPAAEKKKKKGGRTLACLALTSGGIVGALLTGVGRGGEKTGEAFSFLVLGGGRKAAALAAALRRRKGEKKKKKGRSRLLGPAHPRFLFLGLEKQPRSAA